jgi:hypothetical protein
VVEMSSLKSSLGPHALPAVKPSRDGRGMRVSAVCACVVLILTLSACSTVPVQEEVEAAEPTQVEAEPKEVVVQVEPLSEFMDRAQNTESVAGGRESARLIYRDAAKSYPTDKRPWLRLSQSYFDAGDYGNAVLAAQEVVQRDANDSVAQGLLAVSGLRISTAALAALRTQDSLTSLRTTNRSEAENMASMLRSILGEAVLVPKPPELVQEPVQVAPPPPVRRTATVRPKVARSAPAGVAAPAVPAAPAPRANPFGALR